LEGEGIPAVEFDRQLQGGEVGDTIRTTFEMPFDVTALWGVEICVETIAEMSE